MRLLQRLVDDWRVISSLSASRASPTLSGPGDCCANAFPLFVLLRQVLSRIMILANLSVVLVSSCWPQKEWFMDILAFLVEEPLELLLLGNLLVKLACQEVSQRSGDAAISPLEVVK